MRWCIAFFLLVYAMFLTAALSVAQDSSPQCTVIHRTIDDGTPSDIGATPAVNHCYDVWTLPSATQHNGWLWLSFPTLDDLCQILDYDVARVMLDNILGTLPFLLDHFEWIAYPDYPVHTIEYISSPPPHWQNDDHIFTSPQGYKVQMVSEDPTELVVIGFIENPGQEINLYAGEEDPYDNWVGYFLEERREVLELVADIEEKIVSIRGQDWALERVLSDPPGWIGYTDATLEYGDMVVIRVNDDVVFSWDEEVSSGEDMMNMESQYFTYEERADYIPVFIEYTPAGEGEEIGMYVDGVCKGAEACGDTLTQINAYVILPNGSVETGEVEFVITDGGRSFESYSTYGLLENRRLVVRDGKIDLSDGRRYYHISFDDGEADETPSWPMALGAYPNPFNPSTTIRYSLPRDGQATITVYNIRGQRVATLVNERQAAGEHELTWDASGQASGVYLVRLKCDNGTRVHKLLLLK